MSWRLVGVQDQRVEFVVRASRGECLSSLCREFGIARPTGYLWLKRFREQGVAGVRELRRRPRLSPRRTAETIEARIVELRRQRPDWGARKLAVLLQRDGIELPVITVHRVLLRHDLVLDRERRRQAMGRFEREAPNQLWQMDFKGQKGADAAIGPLSVLDDHSRYLVALEQTGTTRGEVVRERLEGIFGRNGVPDSMLMDHGVPWWNASSSKGWTQLSVWLMRQGIRCCFSGIGHPQTQGKVERFHGAVGAGQATSGWRLLAPSALAGCVPPGVQPATSAPSSGDADTGQPLASQPQGLRSQPARVGLRPGSGTAQGQHLRRDHHPRHTVAG